MTKHRTRRSRKLKLTKQEAARRLAVRLPKAYDGHRARVYLEQSLQSPMRVPLKTYVEANWRHVAKDGLLASYAGG